MKKQYYEDLKSYQEIFHDLLSTVFSHPERKEKPTNIYRYYKHMHNWFNSLIELENFNPDKNSRTGIYRIYVDAMDKTIATKILKEMQNDFMKNKPLIIAIAMLHDISKMVANPQHDRNSAEKFLELSKNNFTKLKNTVFYKKILEQLNPQQKNFIYLIIKYHTLGSINFDGNYGQLYALEKSLAENNLTPAEKKEFNKILNLIIDIDRAAVPNPENTGFFTFYDHMLFKELTTKIMSGQDIYQSMEDIAQYIARQSVEIASNKQEVYEHSWPKILEIINEHFTESELLPLFNKFIKNYVNPTYINKFLLHFAFNGNINASKTKDTIDTTALEKYTFIVITMVRNYSTEKHAYEEINEYNSVENKDIFDPETFQLIKKN